MTELTKGRTFLGNAIEGDFSHGYTPIKQLPIEDLYPHFLQAFNKGVKAVMWEQYVPGFNDGDPCEFSIREVKMTTNSVIADAWLDETEPDMEEAYPGEDFYYDEYAYELYSGHPDGLTSADSVSVNSGHYDDALRQLFGQDTKIIVTPERVVQYEYDCGY